MITAIKVAVVLLVIIVGFFYFNASNLSPFIPPSEPAGGAGHRPRPAAAVVVHRGGGAPTAGTGCWPAASLVFFAFIGFDVVATAAEETKNPQRDLPRGIFGSLAIVTVLYVAVTIVLTGMVPYNELRRSAGRRHANLATAFTVNGVDWAANVIASARWPV